jgi:hypothetical protein
MTKKQYLKPWAVARLLPHGKWTIIGRYRSPSDADGHLLLLRQRVPNMQFKVVFDLGDYPNGAARSDRALHSATGDCAKRSAKGDRMTDIWHHSQ